MNNQNRYMQRCFHIALLSVWVFWLGACNQTQQQAKSQASTQLKAFTEPDLSNLGQLIQEEIKKRHLDLSKLEAATQRDVSKLALAYGNLAKFYQAFDFPIQAQYLYQKAIELEPNKFHWQYLLARVFQARFEHDAAKSQFQKAIQIDEFHVPSLLALGEYARNSGNTKEAKTYFNNALLLEKKCVFARRGLAQMAIKAKDFKQASKLMEAALEIQPHGTELHYQAAMAYRGLGNMEKAQYHLDQQKKYSEATYIRDPHMDQVRNLAKQDLSFIERGHRAMEQGNFEYAASQYKSAVLINPSAGETRLRLASAYLQMGQLEEAKTEFETADRLRPGNYQISYNLAGIALQKGDLEEAKKQFLRTVTQHDEHAAAHLKLADLYLIDKDYEKALKHYSRVVEQEPNNPAARVGRCLGLIRLNRYQEAIQTIEADVVQFPSHLSLGVLLVKLLAASPQAEVRDGKRAVTIVETMARAGKSFDILEAGAMAYAETAAFSKAVSWQKEALAIARKARPDRVNTAESLLATYQARKPCRNPFP